MKPEESRPSKSLIAGIVLIAALIPALVATLLVYPPTSTPSGPVSGVSVSIPAGVGANQSLNFSPATITVVVGVNNTVQWTQDDPIPHTVTSDSVPTGAKPFDSQNLNKGAAYSVTLTVPGTYSYHCTYHEGWMKGKIIVKSG